MPNRQSKIKHVFVLMLENRSFDHMLGFSGITGTDAATGQATSIDGLNGSESNSYNGVIYPVLRGAPDRAPHDPPHGFPGVLQQLCGEGAVYVSGEPYPPINNSGFVSIYAKSHPELPDGAMRCFTPDQVPVLTALAHEFVVCDRWFSSMPGPTEPNRWFVHAGTAGFFDEAPSKQEYAESFSSPWSGIAFKQGTIFDRLRDAGLKFRIYACDSFPNVAMLKGISRTFDVDDFDEDFASDVASPSYDAAYTFIEPSYDAFSEFEDGNSHHPLGSVKAGELLIKKTYEALRRSPIWESSLLIVTYDEHGGFYDHVAPPSARATGSKGRKHGFTFDQLGPRVPAVIVSPLIPRNLIDHRPYEHSSVVSTVVRLFDLKELTVRSSLASDVKPLATLDVPRPDAPMTLPDPMGGVVARVVKTPFEASVARQPDRALEDDPTGMMAATIASGLAQHLEVAPPEHEAIVARVNALRTRGEALEYLKEVYVLVKAARQRAGVRRSASVRVHGFSMVPAIRARWLSAESETETGEATRDRPYRVTSNPIIQIIRHGDTSKVDPFTIVFVANPALEIPWNSGVFDIDPVTYDQKAFDACVHYTCDCLFGNLPRQGERLLENPAVAPYVRIVSVFQAGLSAEDQNALVAQDGVSNLLVARREVFVPFLANLSLQADVVYAISQSASHDRASAWFTSDNDAGPGFNFRLDGVTRSHRFYNLIPGTVAMHTSARSLTPLHEFGHALSSYTNGAVVDLYVDSERALNNKRGRPMPINFATYNSTTMVSDTSRNSVSYPAGWQSYHCELLNPRAPAVMDNYYLASGGPETCLHDRITREFLLDRLISKVSR